MSLETEDQHMLDQSINHESQKKFKVSYTRDFLLSLSELDVCKELPGGFDRSLLSEFEDASQDRQRSTGGLSMYSFRRNEYSSSPPGRGDSSNFSRGIHGRWETRSSGRSDKDSDSQSDWDSDSGRCFGNQSRRSWQSPEHDGLLGSGSFPRPSGYAPGSSAPKFRANGQNQLNRSNEPYQPPRPYKAPHSRRETNDSYNDETFGSLECTSEDKVEEERKRRASFELMRKEQQKAFQEKQNLNPEKNKDGFDITLLLDDDEKRLVSRSNESVEPPMTLLALNNDSEKHSFLAQTPLATRPRVPPGFTSTTVERNFLAKSSVNISATEVGQSEIGDTKGNHLFCINSENKEEKLSTKQADIDQQYNGSASLSVSIDNEKERILNLSSTVDVQDGKIGMGAKLRKRSTLSKVLETSDDSEIIYSNAEVRGEDTREVFYQETSNLILEKLFGTSLALNDGNPTSVIEQPVHEADETCSLHAKQSSKFARWFAEEENKPVDDFTSRPNDLLSLIIGSEKGGLRVPDVETTQHSAPDFPFQNVEPAGGHLTSNVAHTANSNSERPNQSNKPEVVPAVLTCEDLEQSILSQISGNGSSLEQPLQDKDFDSKTKQSDADVDDHASQHILSLLHKGLGHRDINLSSILDVDSTGKSPNTEVVTVCNALDKLGEANSDVLNSSKTLTLETLFGTAFMKELQSVGAPLSVQQGPVGSAGVDVSEPLQFPFPVSHNGIPPSTGELALSRVGSGVLPSENVRQPKPNRHEEQWLGYDNPHGDAKQWLGYDNPHGDANSSQFQHEIVRVGGLDGPTDVGLPEENSLIDVGDPLQNFMSSGNLAKAELSQDIPIDVAAKLAALNPAIRDERPVIGNQEVHAYPHGSYDMREPHWNLNVERSSPQLHPLQLNHLGPMFNHLDSHRPHISSQMKFMTLEGMAHHNFPQNHQFSGNMPRPPFHQPSTGPIRFDSPAHHSMLQQMHMSGNIPPPQPLRGFTRGAPMHAHANNPMTGFMQEPNPMQGIPFSSHQQPTFGGPGMPLPAPDIAGGRNHPEALQRLFEMGLRSNSKQIHPFAGGGHSQGMFSQELDLGFGYK